MSDNKKSNPFSPESAPEDPVSGLDDFDLSALEAGEDIPPEQMRAIIEALQGELEAKTQELAEKQDQYVRAVAETENVRRRLEKEKQETAQYAITKFAKDVLSVGDNFQRAISAVPKAAVETDPALKSLLDGVVLAERDYRSALERHGVKPIDPAGQPFDPHQHQAVMEQEDPTVPAGTVLQVFQVGYSIEDRCLRPAMVSVSRGGPKLAKAGGGAGEVNPSPSDDINSGGYDSGPSEPRENT